MHLPDGFLDTRTAVSTAVLAGGAVAVSLRSLNVTLPRKRVPLMGLAAAFVFAAQMINFPVVGGTSGHLMGGMLACVLLGPSAAIVVMTSVLTVQCFLFADGGVFALGANVLNMAVAAPLAGWGVYRTVTRLAPGERGRYVGIAVGAWASAVLASTLCAGELAWSGTVGWQAAFPAMVNVHMVIGLGEAIITVLVLSVVLKARPDLAYDGGTDRSGFRYGDVAAYGGIIAVCLALFVAPFASPLPDGLEKVAMQLGFDRGAAAPAGAPLGGYSIPGIGSPAAATGIAGAAGTILMFAVGYLLARIAVPSRGTGMTTEEPGA
jgi:cobalt/nickel transport system permease protein